MNTKEENLNKVINRMNDESLWDDIYVTIAEDEDDVAYVICDSWDDSGKFIEMVRQTLGIDSDNFSDLDVEKHVGAVMVFGDEYSTCSDCGKVIRTSPDSYHWQPDFHIGDGYIACNQCFNGNEDYQEEYLEERINNPEKAVNGVMSEQQIMDLGFERVDETFEDGWYHVNDDPKVIYNRLSEKYDDILFLVNNVEQFRINFVAFVRGVKE